MLFLTKTGNSARLLLWYVGQCPLLSMGQKLDFNSVWNRIRFLTI